MNGPSTARLLYQLWFITVAVLAIAVLYLAKVLFLPLGFAILFAFLLAPAVALLERLRVPRPVAALLVILAFASLLCTAAWSLFTQLSAIANDLPIYRENITQKMQAIHTPSDSAFGRAEQELQQISDELGIANSSAAAAVHPSGTREEPVGSTAEHPMQVREVGRPNGRLDQLGGIVEPVTTALLSVVFTFFVLLQREDLRNRLIRLSGDRNLSRMTQAMSDASRRISRYFLLQVVVNFVFGSLVSLTLSLIGLPHAVLFGALASICRFVPYLGVPTAAIAPTVLSLAVFHGWRHTVLIVATFILLEVVTGNYAEPHIYGRHTGLSSLAILIAASFWTLIWGPVGLVLSVPLTVCLIVMGSHVPSLGFLTVLLGDQPVIPPYTSFFQRLLARDEQEAADILDSALKSSPLVVVYDSILLPALTMVEKERQQGVLDDDALRFIRNSSSEMVDELGFRALEDQIQALDSGLEASPAVVVNPGVDPTNTSGRVVVIPVRDGADELVATMLTQVLSVDAFKAASIPVRPIDQTIAAVKELNPDLIVLSGMPPVAMARAHRLYWSLRKAFAGIRINVGIWNYTEDHSRVAQMIIRTEQLHISTCLTDALAQARACFNQRPSVPEPLDVRPQLVSTPTDTAA